MQTGASSGGNGGVPLILTPDQRLRVFVSSTLRELAEERVALKKAISALSLTPVMFELGARPHPPRALYRSYLDQSHIFIGVYWQSYGWVAPEEQVSGLEDEYRLSSRLPRLLYVKDPAPDRDSKLTELLERIQADDLASYKPFTSADELGQLVTDDLMLLLSEQFQTAAHGDLASVAGDLRFTPPAEPLTPLVGRDQETDALVDLIRQGTRLLTLTGAGGVGKSRLAVEVAHMAHSAFGIDLHFVDLTPLSSADGVLPEIARGLGIPVEGNRGPMQSLIDYLATRRLLLLLDNFEHVAAAAVDLPELLSACAALQILVTSRQVLRLRGETEYPLAPLPVPSVDLTADEMRLNPTVRLFVDRAQAAQPSFELTIANLESVAEISRRLDGIPLAIELAAARVRLLPPNLLLDRLESRLDLLSSGAADMPERQRTLWRAIDWSYNLLTPDEQAFFAQLAVFVDGWTLDAAEDVCTTGSGSVLDTLVALLEKSLLVVVTAPESGEPRMRMLVPVHQYADQKLGASGDREALRRRHADYYGRWTEVHATELRGPEQEAWSQRFASEEGNLRAAEGFWEETGSADALARFMWSTFIYYWLTGRLLQEFATWVEAATAMAGQLPAKTRGRLAVVNSFRALDFGSLDEAAATIDEAVCLLQGDGSDPDLLLAKTIQATVMGSRGDPAAAAVIQEVLDSPSLPDDPWVEGMAHWTAGGLALFGGDLKQAEFHHAQAVALGRSLGSWQVLGQGVGRLAFVYLAQGRIPDAIAALKESVECFRRIHFREGLSYDLFALASALSVLGEPVAATRALGAADAVQRLIGIPMWQVYRDLVDALRSQLETLLGDDFTPAWSEGQGTDVYVAADRALAAANAAG
jgi:predicted ATPase